MASNKWPAEQTSENFQEQAEALDAFLREEGKKNPSNLCKSISEFVETFYHSGTARMHAGLLLHQEGYHALASLEGLQWLMETYPAA